MVKMLETFDLNKLESLDLQEIHVYKHRTYDQTMAARQARIAEQDRKAMNKLKELLSKINDDME